jgi:hypothetical protein
MTKRDSATDFRHPLLQFIPSPLGEKVAEGRMRGRSVCKLRIRKQCRIHGSPPSPFPSPPATTRGERGPLERLVRSITCRGCRRIALGHLAGRTPGAAGAFCANFSALQSTIGEAASKRVIRVKRRSRAVAFAERGGLSQRFVSYNSARMSITLKLISRVRKPDPGSLKSVPGN